MQDKEWRTVIEINRRANLEIGLWMHRVPYPGLLRLCPQNRYWKNRSFPRILGILEVTGKI